MPREDHRARIRCVGRTKRHLPHPQKLGWMRYVTQTRRQDVTGRPGRAFNHLEARFAELLDSWGIAYQWQFRLGHYRYDFRLPGRLLVEVHGGYWHGDPQSYPAERLSWVQRRNRDHDDRKARFARSRGYTVRVVWESDIRLNRVSRSDLLAPPQQLHRP